MCASAELCIASVFAADRCTTLSAMTTLSQGTAPNSTVLLRRGALVWSGTPLSFAAALPVASNGVLFTSNAAINLYSGQLIWNTTVTANDNEDALVVGSQLVVCGVSPAFENECCSLSQSDGAMQWRVPLGSTGPVLYAWGGAGVVVQTVYNTSDPLHVQLLTLSPITGTVLWNRTIDVGWYLGWAGDVIFVNTFASSDSQAAGVSALNSSTGETIWSAAVEGSWNVTDGRPDVFFSGSALVINFKNSNHYHAFDVLSGRMLWATALHDYSCPGWPGMVSSASDTVLCTGQQSATLLNMSTGASIWSFEGPQLCAGGSAAALGPNATQLLFSFGGVPPNCTAMFSVSAVTGQLVWEGMMSQCPLQVIASEDAFFTVQFDNVNRFNAGSFSLEYEYVTPLMVSQQVQQAAVIDSIMLLVLLDGNSAMQAFWL
jgi:outer membrane protein assembly factor BamB